MHRVLAEGRYGYAHLASHPTLAMPVILKTFKKSDKAWRFRQEASLAVRAASAYVVPVLDAGVEEGVSFIVQHYVDGLDLEELRTNWPLTGARFPVGLGGRIIADAARGLQDIAVAGVIHRDIKPQNIFLSGDGRVFIGDFGIALDPATEAHERAVGPVVSMAPEQWGDGPIDERADIYALGVSAHMLMTGEDPFSGDSIDAYREAHERQPYIPPTASDPREAHLYSVIERMVRKAPAERYATAGDVVRALDPVIEEPCEYTRQAPDHFSVGPLTLTLTVGDLATARATILVHAAHVTMRMDTDIAAALRRRGGVLIEQLAMAQAPARIGDVMWTSAGVLDAQWIAHAVCAVEGVSCIARCLLRVLISAEVRSAVSLALPALGTGSGAPMSLTAKRILDAIRTFASLRPTRVRSIQIVLSDTTAQQQWQAVLQSMISQH